jgi:hypothetical protein
MRIGAPVATGDLEAFCAARVSEAFARANESGTDARPADIFRNDKGGDAGDRRGTMEERNDMDGAQAKRNDAINSEEDNVVA